MTADRSAKKEGRLARDLRALQEVSRDPRSIVPRARGWLAAVWAANGGGFFGLGYVLTFVALEATTLAGAVGGTSTSGFIVGQVVQYLLRFSVESILNAFLALLWPIYLWRWLGLYSLILLAVLYVCFEFALRPVIELWFPELEQARIERTRLKQEKRDRKRRERAKQ